MISHGQRKFVLVVFVEQIGLLLVEEFNALLCVTDEDILGVEKYFCSCDGSYDLGIDTEFSAPWVLERNLSFIVSGSHNLDELDRFMIILITDE